MRRLRAGRGTGVRIWNDVCQRPPCVKGAAACGWGIVRDGKRTTPPVLRTTSPYTGEAFSARRDRGEDEYKTGTHLKMYHIEWMKHHERGVKLENRP